ncbi:hypothetical protein VDGL01_01007 [Verticillium dahliae]
MEHGTIGPLTARGPSRRRFGFWFLVRFVPTTTTTTDHQPQRFRLVSTLCHLVSSRLGEPSATSPSVSGTRAEGVWRARHPSPLCVHCVRPPSLRLRIRSPPWRAPESVGQAPAGLLIAWQTGRGSKAAKEEANIENPNPSAAIGEDLLSFSPGRSRFVELTARSLVDDAEPPEKADQHEAGQQKARLIGHGWSQISQTKPARPDQPDQISQTRSARPDQPDQISEARTRSDHAGSNIDEARTQTIMGN